MQEMEVVTIGDCPQCGGIHQYEVKVFRALIGESDELAEERGDQAFRTRLFECPKTDETFQYRFPLVEKAGTKIIEVRISRTLNDDDMAKESFGITHKAERDPFMDEVRKKHTPWSRNDLQSSGILPAAGSIRTVDGKPDLDGIINEQLKILEEYAGYNLGQAKKDRLRFWAFKLPALLCAASTAAFEALGTGSAVIVLGVISAICIGIDAAWPGGMLHDVHLRAARETRRLQQTVLTEWRKAYLQSPKSSKSLQATASELLSTIQKERQRIDKYVTDAEASLQAGE